MTPILNKPLVETIINDKNLRINLTKESLLYFATVYFPHYFGYDFAQFQYDMLQMVEDKDCLFAVTITFRGSGKSTLLTTISPLWAIMGVMAKKHVILVCQTQEQARAHMSNIKDELEENELLRNDLGPFKEGTDTWNAMTLEFSNYGAKITAVSIDQTVRGIRNRQYRPDFIICDDIENSSSVKTKEGRARIQQLYSSEIAPLGDINTKVILVGNYLHPNSLLANLMESIAAGNQRGKSLFVPLINDEGQIAWPQKFPDFESIEQMRERVADDRIWMQEYMLKIVPEEDQLVRYEDIVWYTDLPAGWEPRFQFRAAGVDLAISKDSRADLTAIVSGSVYRDHDECYIFIDPNPTNRRFNFRETIEFLLDFKKVYPDRHLFVESTGYQRALVEQLIKEGIDAHDVQIGTMSKEERLARVVYWIRKGQVRFPRGLATDLVNQMVNLGSELHDDLVDALTLLVNQVMEYAKTGTTPNSLNTSFGKVRIKGMYPSVLYGSSQKFNLKTLEGDPYGWN